MINQSGLAIHLHPACSQQAKVLELVRCFHLACPAGRVGFSSRLGYDGLHHSFLDMAVRLHGLARAGTPDGIEAPAPVCKQLHSPSATSVSPERIACLSVTVAHCMRFLQKPKLPKHSLIRARLQSNYQCAELQDYLWTPTPKPADRLCESGSEESGLERTVLTKET